MDLVNVMQSPQDRPASTATDHSAQHSQIPSHQGVTLRVLLLSVPLIIVNNYWIMQTETIRYAGFPTTISLYYNVVFILLILMLVNLVLRRIAPRAALNHGELLVVYTILCLASSTAGHDAIQVLTPTLTHAFQYADPSNQWATLFHQYLPKWAMMSDPVALKGLYEGETELYRPENYTAWIQPVLLWTAFISALYLVTLCLNTVYRRRWVHSERLTYPIVQLPLEMTRPGSTMFWSRGLWVAFGVVMAIDLLNGLHMFYPNVPQIPVKVAAVPQFNIGAQFIDRPWNAMGTVYVSFYPVAIGLGMLLPTELVFSCIFFFWFWRGQQIAAAQLGWTQLRGFPFIEEQTFAGYIGLAAFAAWTSRSYLVQVWRRIIGLPSEVDDRGEAVSFRTAFILGLVGFAFLVAFTVHAGASLWYAVAFFVIHFGLALSVTRIRAEMGLPAHDLHHAGPGQILYRIVGGVNLSPRDRTVSNLYYWFNRAYRSYASPHQAEGFKLAERTGTDIRRLFPTMVGAIALGALAAFWAILHLGYKDGFAAKVQEPKVSLIFGREPWDALTGQLNAPEAANVPAVWAMVMGFVFVFGLMSLKMNCVWWPIHPIGYAVSGSWSMMHLWCPFVIAWSVKWTITRYGGHEAFRRAVPYALGMILGDLVGGSLWTIYGILKHVPTYSIWV